MRCGVCGTADIRKSGKITVEKMTKEGPKQTSYQSYRCRKGHFFTQNPSSSRFTNSFIEYAVVAYLKSLSLNTTVDLLRIYYERDVITKKGLLELVESVADQLPTIDDIDHVFHPLRSGYLAFDGVWFQFGREQVVLLVCFDPETFDVVVARWEDEERQEGYVRLLTDAVNKIGASKVKGVYGDGDRGLLGALKLLLPHVPFQLCVFHKELRMGSVVPVKSVGVSRRLTAYQKHDIKVFQLLFREVIYAASKEASIQAFHRLKEYAKSDTHAYPEKFMTAYRALAHNFTLTLTHFDHPDMKRDNNLLECFNGCIKPRLRLMKGFKKEGNLDRYLKLFLLEFRFHPLTESRFKDRRGKSPLVIARAVIPAHYNFIKMLRQTLKLTFEKP